MDDRRRPPNDGKSSHCLWQGELKLREELDYGEMTLACRDENTLSLYRFGGRTCVRFYTNDL